VSPVDGDVEVDERVQPPFGVRLDRADHARWNGLLTPGERERGGLAEPVVLEAGQRGGGRTRRRAVDHAGLDPALAGAQPEVDVRGRDHRVAAGQEDRVAVLGRRKDRPGVFLHARPVADLDLGVVERPQVGDVRAREPRRVELDERAVGARDRLAALDGDRALVVEPQADERKHTPVRSSARLTGPAPPSRRERPRKRHAYPGGPPSRRMDVPCASVPREAGEAARRVLADRDLLADEYRITAGEGRLYLPVSDPGAAREALAEAFGDDGTGTGAGTGTYAVVSRDVPARERQTLPPDLLGFEPSYERLGDIAILDEDDPERARTVADALLESDLPVRSVLDRASKVSGRERVREWNVLAGDTETVHREYGFEYALDVAEVYFSPRLATERHRVTEQVEADERCFDMFAGVGPFVIPMAARGADCVGVDVNDRAVAYLRENARRNGVEERVTAVCADVWTVEGYDDWATRVVMNLPHSADRFLDTAIRLAGEECVLHYYDIQPEAEPFDPGERAIRAAAGDAYDATVETRRVVRSYAPHELNVCLDVRLTRGT